MKWFLSLPIFFLLSCSSLDGLPTEEMALNKLKQSEFGDRTNDFIEIVEFKKTNGVKQTIFGQDIYKLEYSLKIKFKQNAHSVFSNDLKNFETDKELDKWIYSHPMRSSSGNNYPIYYAKYKHFKKGQVVEINDNVEFQKAENGWR